MGAMASNNNDKTRFDGMDAVSTVTHSKSGASAQVHAFGATVLSYRDAASKQEHLFVSKQAKLDGTKAIRGGIPLVFPIFGPPSDKASTMPQHGFARNNTWKLESVKDEAEAAIAVYSLEFADVTAGCGENNPWNKEQAAKDGTNCRLTYEVRVCPQELITTLTILNTGTAAFNFQALQHTYLAVPNSSKVQVHGLGGYTLTDKVDSSRSGQVQSYDEHVKIEGEVDAVYVHPKDHNVVKATVQPVNVQVEAAGQVADSPTAASCVVWNPGPAKAAAMGDFGDDEYKTMVCVEPGLLGHQPLVPPQASARLTQTLRVPTAST